MAAKRKTYKKRGIFSKLFANKKLTALLFVVLFGAMGGAYIMFSKAATVAPRVAMAHWRNYGYWIAASDGQVENFGEAKFYGSPKKSGLNLDQGITDIASRRDGTGYWLLGGDGGVFAYGGAKYLGKPPANDAAGYYRSIVSTPTGDGYWVISKLGTVYEFGDAKTTYKVDYGAANYTAVMGTIQGVDTIVDADHAGGDGKGLFMLDRNGKVYVAGTAKAYYAGGSGTLDDGEQASGIAADITTGYLITTNKGRVVARGEDVTNVGGMYGKKLDGAITGVQKIGRSSDLSTYGYWLVGRDGGVFAFGKVTFHGSKPIDLHPSAPTPTPTPAPTTTTTPTSTPAPAPTPTCPAGGSDAICVTEVALNLKSSVTGRKIAVNGVFGQDDREACLLYRAKVGSYPGVCKDHLEPAPEPNKPQPNTEYCVEYQSSYDAQWTTYNNLSRQTENLKGRDTKYYNYGNASAKRSQSYNMFQSMRGGGILVNGNGYATGRCLLNHNQNTISLAYNNNRKMLTDWVNYINGWWSSIPHNVY